MVKSEKHFNYWKDAHPFYKNINKTQRIRKLEKKLKREQKRLSRKYEFLKKRGGTATKSNINKKMHIVKIMIDVAIFSFHIHFSLQIVICS